MSPLTIVLQVVWLYLSLDQLLYLKHHYLMTNELLAYQAWNFPLRPCLHDNASLFSTVFTAKFFILFVAFTQRRINVSNRFYTVTWAEHEELQSCWKKGNGCFNLLFLHSWASEKLRKLFVNLWKNTYGHVYTDMFLAKKGNFTLRMHLSFTQKRQKRIKTKMETVGSKTFHSFHFGEFSFLCIFVIVFVIFV